jgi:uncharacterized NAD(P)/FAD-binding protein YdhS
VLLLGSGLTMVDMAIALKARGHSGDITAISRHGLLPHAHEPAPPRIGDGASPSDARLSHMLGWLRRRAEAEGWRAAVDDLRPATQALWRRADIATRRRFMRHLRPWWDVHRHRMAPRIADRIGQMQARGELKVEAGRILAVAPSGGGALVDWRPRGGAERQLLYAELVINCRGFGAGEALLRDQLLGDLTSQGLGRLDALGLGLDVDDECRLVGADGGIQPRIYAVGPLTRGAFWETIAVPDIRNQVAEVAARLAATLRWSRTSPSPQGEPRAARAGGSASR